MNSKKIEQYAVNAVEQVINRSQYLSPYFSTNDKEPSWDGHIYIYSDPSQENNYLIGRIPVQIKGTVKKYPFPDGEFKYQLPLEHLKNYYKDGGAILFVVCIYEPTSPVECIKTQVYYADLTPVKLAQLFSFMKKKDQKTLGIPVVPIPNHPDKLADICLNCSKNRKKQMSFTERNFPTLEKLEASGNLESISFNTYSCKPIEDPFDSVLGKEIYLYAKVKGSDTPIPIEGVPVATVFSYDVDHNVSVNGETFYTSYKVNRFADRFCAIIGKGLTLTFYKSDQSNQINFREPPFLRDRVKILRFWLASIENQGFEIDDHSIPIPAQISEPIDCIKLKERLNFFERAVETLDKLHCEDDLDVEQLSDTDFRNLNLLMLSVLEDAPIRGLRDDLSYTSKLDIGNLHFIVFLFPHPQDSHAYQMSDFFSKEVRCGGQLNENDEMQPMPKYAFLHKEEFLQTSNIDFNALLPAYKKFEITSFLLTVANITLINLISAYDEATGPRKEQIYQAAYDFADWLCSMDEWDKTLGTLNKLQVIKRKRELDDREKDLLYDMEGSTHDPFLLVGVYLLLDDMDRAKRAFSRLDKEKQKEFVNYPIYKFWKVQEE